jgi:hypothetical protein
MDFIRLHSPFDPGSCPWMVSSHLSRRCLFTRSAISLFRGVILGDVGSFLLRPSLISASCAASVGNDGRTNGIRPTGMYCLAAFSNFFLKICSAFSGQEGWGRLSKASSVDLVNPSQLAFLKLMKVRFPAEILSGTDQGRSILGHDLIRVRGKCSRMCSMPDWHSRERCLESLSS